MRVWLPLLLTGTLFFQSCKSDKVSPVGDPEVNTLKVSMQPEFNGSALSIDQTFTTNEGYLVQFTELKCYFEDVRNGEKLLIDAGLFDYKLNGKEFIEAEGNPEDFTAISANLGVQQSLNHSDPALFPNSSALNIINANDMHWDWNPGYIFVKIEARVDTIPDGTELFDHNVVFHVGGDVNRQVLQFNSVNWVHSGDNVYHLPLRLDMGTFLNNGAQSIDLKTEFMTHTSPGQEALSLKVMQQFAAAISTY